MTLPYSLAQRSVEAAHGYLLKRKETGGQDKPDVQEVPVLGGLIFFLTLIAFLVWMVTLSYTYGHLITTLCMVESSSSQAYVPIGSDDAPPEYTEDGLPKPADAELNIIRTQPITASLRETVAHLKTRGGFRSRFRGFGVYMVWNFSRSVLTGIISLGSANPFPTILAAIVAEVALASVHMTWIHVVISEPSTRRWYQRIPFPYFRTWKKIAPAVAIWAVTSQVVTIFPLLVTNSFGVLRHLRDPDYAPGMKDAYAGTGQLFFAALLTLTLFVLLQIPATVAMVRVAASMLPEEDETIVPFDRTFGGLTTPEIIGGQGKIGIVEAWRSFNGECRRRLLRTVVKVAALIMTTWLAFSFLIMLEAQFLIGPAFGDIMKGLHGAARKGSGN